MMINFLPALTKSFPFLLRRRHYFRYLSIATRLRQNKSYYFRNGNIPLSCITLGNVLDNAANANGDSTAIVSCHQDTSKTYLELRNEAQRLASGLIKLGLQEGDRIAIYSPSCYEWLLTLWASAKAGLILVNLNYLSQPPELEYVLRKVDCAAVISYDKLKSHDYYEVFNNIIPDLHSRKQGEHIERLPRLNFIIMITDEAKKGTVRFKDILNLGDKESDQILSRTERRIQFDSIVNIQFTSGTIGLPKGVALTHHNIVNNAMYMGQNICFETLKPILCCQVPLNHSFGCDLSIMSTIINQGTTVLPNDGYDPVESLKAIEKYRCNTVIGTPTMISDVISSQKRLQSDISSLKHVLLGAAPIPAGLIQDLHRDFKVPNIRMGYGLSETSPTLSITVSGASYETLLDGFMEPLEEQEIKIIDSKGNIVPKGIEGEICSRGYSTFSCYWDDEIKTAEAIDKAKWFHTGDIGVMNDKGWIKVAGRIKDLVIRGGENIHVAEVEFYLSTHPAILEVNVCGVPDPRLGEELCSWISLKPGMTLTEEEIRSFCAGKLIHYKIPRYIMFVKEFPKTTSGKIRRKEMARMSLEKLKL